MQINRTPSNNHPPLPNNSIKKNSSASPNPILENPEQRIADENRYAVFNNANSLDLKLENFIINLGAPPSKGDVQGQLNWSENSINKIIENKTLRLDQIEIAIKRILGNIQHVSISLFHIREHAAPCRKYTPLIFKEISEKKDLESFRLSAPMSPVKKVSKDLLSTNEIVKKALLIINSNIILNLHLSFVGREFSRRELYDLMLAMQGKKVSLLNMSSTNISQPPQLEIFASHLKNIHIEELDISDNKLNNENIRAIAPSLPQSLKKLILSLNSITHQEIENLSTTSKIENIEAEYLL